jgi:two-component system sensor histidine kinase/response regulator
MDWRMPGMDGLQAARVIKNESNLKTPPAIVMVTAFGREEVRDEAERLQLDGFLVKPVTKSMIVDALVSVFVDPADQAAAVSTAAEAGVNLSGLRVLLAEDNEINQQIAVELLEGVGAKVTVANHGREAVEKLSAGSGPPPFDIVLMDLQMPELDGYQATAQLRTDARFAALPIVAMTAHATMEERQRCLAAGMNDHVAKPIDPGVLFETLARFHQPTAAARRAAQASRAPFAVETPAIAGIDLADGLARVGGNRKLYLRLLRQFATGQANAATEVAGQLAAGDLPTAERSAHTIKGVAGNLGAKELQAAAAELEKSVRERAGPAALANAHRRFATTLTGLLENLHATLGPESDAPASPPPAPFDPVRARPVVAEMRTRLADFDAAAGDILAVNRPVLAALFSAGDFAQFERHLQNYAFGDALALLETTARARGIEGP